MKIKYDENIVHSLLCIWEAILDLRAMPESYKAAKILDDYMATWGTATTRDMITSCSLVTQIEKHWAAYEEAKGDAFDWDFVPLFLCEFIIRTGHNHLISGKASRSFPVI